MSNWADVFDDLGFVADGTDTDASGPDSVADWEHFLPEPGEGGAADELDGLLTQLVAAASDDDLADDLFVPRGERRPVAAEQPVGETREIDDEPAFAEVADDVAALTADPATDPAIDPADDRADTTSGAPLDLDEVVIEFEPVVLLDDEPSLPDEPLPLDDDLC